MVLRGTRQSEGKAVPEPVPAPPVLRRGPAGVEGHAQRIADEPRPHVIGHRPPDDPLRDFLPRDSDHRSHTVLTRRLHAYLPWRNEHASDPALRERLRHERARPPLRVPAALGSPAPTASVAA